MLSENAISPRIWSPAFLSHTDMCKSFLFNVSSTFTDRFKLLIREWIFMFQLTVSEESRFFTSAPTCFLNYPKQCQQARPRLQKEEHMWEWHFHIQAQEGFAFNFVINLLLSRKAKKKKSHLNLSTYLSWLCSLDFNSI